MSSHDIDPKPSGPQSTAATMRAIVQDRYGPADVLQLRDITRPHVPDDGVLIRVHAAGVDRGVWHLMTGIPHLARVVGFGLRAPKTPVPGMDVAGIVHAVGTDVTRLRPGDKVFGVAKGSFAEFAVAGADKLAPKPAHLTFVQAAATPISALTALHGLRDHARIEPGQAVLIVGASGGVGSFAVQIAKATGCEVTGVCSTPKVDLVRSLGADHIIDYTREDFADQTRAYDVILDIGGNSSLTRLRRALTDRGTLLIAGGEDGGRWFGGLDRQLRAHLLSPLVKQRLGSFMSYENRQDLLALTELIDAGMVRPAIDRTYPLEQAPEAMRYLEEGRARGKVVLTVRNAP